MIDRNSVAIRTVDWPPERRRIEENLRKPGSDSMNTKSIDRDPRRGKEQKTSTLKTNGKSLPTKNAIKQQQRAMRLPTPVQKKVAKSRFVWRGQVYAMEQPLRPVNTHTLTNMDASAKLAKPSHKVVSARRSCVRITRVLDRRQKWNKKKGIKIKRKGNRLSL